MNGISIAATKRGKDNSIEGVFKTPKVVVLVPTASRAVRRGGEIERLIKKAKVVGDDVGVCGAPGSDYGFAQAR